jgi:hypothetical protein
VLALTLLVMVAIYKFFMWAMKRGGSDMMTTRVLEYMDNREDVIDSAESAIGLFVADHGGIHTGVYSL